MKIEQSSFLDSIDSVFGFLSENWDMFISKNRDEYKKFLEIMVNACDSTIYLAGLGGSYQILKLFKTKLESPMIGYGNVNIFWSEPIGPPSGRNDVLVVLSGSLTSHVVKKIEIFFDYETYQSLNVVVITATKESKIFENSDVRFYLPVIDQELLKQSKGKTYKEVQINNLQWALEEDKEMPWRNLRMHPYTVFHILSSFILESITLDMIIEFQRNKLRRRVEKWTDH